MISTLELLRGAVDAVSIHPPASFTWFGQRMSELPDEVVRTLTPEAARDYVLYNLQSTLYRSFYCLGVATPVMEADHVGRGAKSSLVEVLSVANSGRGPHEAGWEVCRLDGDHVVVGRDGLHLWVSRAEMALSDAEHLDLGSPVSVRFPKELRKLLPGFYMALGDIALPERGEPVVRFYWNLSPQGAPALVRELTVRLNRGGVAFRLKVLDDERAFTRCDAGVLYTRAADYRRVAHHVAATYAELLESVKPATPAFARQLAPGLSLAEDPGTGESFGVHRCTLVAEGLIRAAESGAGGGDDRLSFVVERFEQERVSLDQPHLNPGSRGDYRWPAAVGRSPGGSRLV